MHRPPSSITARTALAALSALLALAMLAGCGGDEDADGAGIVRTVTVTEGSSDIDSAPSDDEESGDDTEEINGRTALQRTVGQTGKDGAITFRVTAIEPTAPIQREFDDPISAPSGARLIRATVVIRNDGKVKVDPFCGNSGAILIDDQGRNFEFDSGSVSIDGNSICEGVQPGFRSTETLVFAIPEGARPEALALWDGNEPDDFEGATYVRFSR